MANYVATTFWIDGKDKEAVLEKARAVDWKTDIYIYNVKVDENKVCFRTKRHFPSSLFEEIANEFDVEIYGKYHDEFFGFCGKFEIKEGKMSVVDDSDGEEAKAYLRMRRGIMEAKDEREN